MWGASRYLNTQSGRSEQDDKSEHWKLGHVRVRVWFVCVGDLVMQFTQTPGCFWNAAATKTTPLPK